MIALLLLFLTALGSLSTALGMNRHYRTVFGVNPAPNAKRKARWAGAAILLASLICSIAADGAAIGAVQWIILWGLSATAVSIALPAFRDRGKAGSPVDAE